MNNLFNELIDLLRKEFKKFDLDESVKLNLSKIPEFDMQINNLVKHNQADFFNNLQKNIIEIIKDHNLISLPLSKGHKAIKLKTTANTIPKLLFEPILISLVFNLYR